jgi:hypothetical protein
MAGHSRQSIGATFPGAAGPVDSVTSLALIVHRVYGHRTGQTRTPVVASDRCERLTHAPAPFLNGVVEIVNRQTRGEDDDE